MTSGRIVLCVLLWMVSCCTVSFVCEPQCGDNLSTNGYTVPKGDILLEYGNNSLEIYCRLNDAKVDVVGSNASSYLSFIMKTERINDSFVHIVNASTAVLRMEKLPILEQMFTCMFNVSEMVCVNLVTVGKKPEPVSNFDCIGYNFENFTCQWYSSNETNVVNEFDLYYVQGHYTSSCTNIIAVAFNTYSCSWTLYDMPYYRLTLESFDLFITVKNEFGEATSNYSIDHYSHVKPNAPENLMVIEKTAFSIFLQWSIPRQMSAFVPGLKNRLVYKSECDGNSDWNVMYLTSLPTDNRTFVYDVNNLKYAYTLYDFRISLAAAMNVSNTLWSDFSSITNRTLGTIPGIPKITAGSFEIIKKSEIETEVLLYWQRIHDCYKNGPDFKYEVRVSSKSMEVFRKEALNSYLMISNLDNSIGYFVEVYAINSFGSSKQSMRISIPAEDKVISVPEDFIVVLGFGNGTYEISWRNLSIVDNYTVYWCNHEDSTNEYTHCSGTLHWRKVSRYVNAVNVTVANNDLYEFAVSAESSSPAVMSSGLIWSQCTVWAVNTVSRIKNVWFHQVSHDFLVITWRFTCLERIGLPKSILATYCAIMAPDNHNCKDMERNITFPGELAFITIDNLTPYTTYKIRIKFSTKHGNVLKSDLLFNTTMEYDPEPPSNIHVTYDSSSTTAFTIFWQKPRITNGRIREYIVRVFDSNLVHVSEIHTDPIANRTVYSAYIHNLTSYRLYHVQVLACTVRCTKSRLYDVKTRIDSPSTMLRPNVINNNSYISVEWQKPVPPNGPISFYQLEVMYDQNSGIYHLNVTKANNVSFRSLDNIQCGIVKVRVRACNVYQFDDNNTETVSRKRSVDKSKYVHYLYGEWSQLGETNLCHEGLLSGRLYDQLVLICAIVFIPILLIVAFRMYWSIYHMNAINVKLPTNFMPSKVYFSKGDCQMKNLNNTGKKTDEGKGKEIGDKVICPPPLTDEKLDQNDDNKINQGFEKVDLSNDKVHDFVQSPEELNYNYAENVTSTTVPNVTSAPATIATNMTATAATNMTVTPATNMTATPVTNMTATPATNMTCTPATNMTCTPATNMTATPGTNISESPASNTTAPPAPKQWQTRGYVAFPVSAKTTSACFK